VKASEEEGGEAHIWILLMIDSGIRLGEVEALQWGHVHFGEGPDDEERHLHIQQSKSRGGAAGLTKSGRTRRIQMSRRLWKALAAWRAESGAHADGDAVTGMGRQVFACRFRDIAKQAGVAGFTAKSLRDTFASHLLSRNVSIAEISGMLGHSSIATTERHYAQLLSYKHQRPFIAEPGQVPADLLAEVGEGNRHQIATTSKDGARNH
jgi:integrase